MRDKLTTSRVLSRKRPSQPTIQLWVIVLKNTRTELDLFPMNFAMTKTNPSQVAGINPFSFFAVVIFQRVDATTLLALASVDRQAITQCNWGRQPHLDPLRSDILQTIGIGEV